MLVTYYETVKRNEETGYTEFMVEPQEVCEYVRDGLVKCSGKIAVYTNGIPIEIEGTWTGTELEVVRCEIPKDNLEIVLSRYLSSSIIKQLKKEKGTQDILEYLQTSESKDLLGDNYPIIKSLYESERISNWLFAYDIPADRIAAVLEKNISLEKIKAKPYENLCYSGISIYQVDRLAQDLGFTMYNNHRIVVWIILAVQNYVNSGNTIVEVQRLTKYINAQMKKSAFPETVVSKSMILSKVIQEKTLCLEYKSNNVYVGLQRIREEEETIVKNLKRINVQKQSIIENPEIMDTRVNEEQRDCYNALKTSGIKIITGPPGSGKTTVIKGLIQSFQKAHPSARIKLSATTGQASKVLKAEVGKRASTVHRMLDIRPYAGRQNVATLDAGLIVVDEMSMCGIQLFSYLLTAVRSGAIVILVGDENQLQSVDYGNVLHDLIESQCFEVYRLTKVIRQSGLIYENSKKVNQGVQSLQSDETFEVKRFLDLDSMYQSLEQEYMGQEGVVSPIKDGKVGTNSLNTLFQQKYHQGEVLLEYGDRKYYQNDYIQMEHTNYAKGYINGEFGRLKAYRNGIAHIEIDGKEITLSRAELRDMNLAYTITIHKSQGTEMPTIKIVLPKTNMLSRRLLYTAITRAKQKVQIYTEKDALEVAIRNTNEHKRETMLLQKIQEEFSPESELDG